MIKKLILLLTVLLFANPCNASNWVEFSYKSYFDLESLQGYNGIATVWTKMLNTGSIDPINGKKVWFEKIKLTINCNTKMVKAQDYAVYDIDGNILFSEPSNNYHFEGIIPDSVGDQLYNAVCPQKTRPITDEYWVKIAPDAEIDINSLLMTNKKCTNMLIKLYNTPATKGLKRKTLYATALFSVNLFDKQASWIEIIEYDKNHKPINYTQYQNLHYQNITNDSIINKAIDFITNLTEQVEIKQNNK